MQNLGEGASGAVETAPFRSVNRNFRGSRLLKKPFGMSAEQREESAPASNQWLSECQRLTKAI
ncbi:MAG: hypothetical protein ACRD18_02100, partial [Terriglobia bacterium]